MYYQNNDEYMRDFFNYNPNINNSWGYQYGPNGFGYKNAQNGNFDGLYPDIYRIIMPVIRRVVAGNNYQYLTEDVLNNMVDTVYNIVDGDKTINNMTNFNEPSNRNENSSNTDVRRNASGSGCNSNNQTINSETNKNNENLLKDMIKILVLQETIKQNRRNFNNINPNYNMVQNQYLPSYFEPIGYM